MKRVWKRSSSNVLNEKSLAVSQTGRESRPRYWTRAVLGRWCAKTSFPSTRQRVSAYGVLIETSSELADLNLEVSGVVLQVRAAVGDKLPVAVFLGTDVPIPMP